jgi:hypothetical protein
MSGRGAVPGGLARVHVDIEDFVGRRVTTRQTSSLGVGGYTRATHPSGRSSMAKDVGSGEGIGRERKGLSRDVLADLEIEIKVSQ